MDGRTEQLIETASLQHWFMVDKIIHIQIDTNLILFNDNAFLWRLILPISYESLEYQVFDILFELNVEIMCIYYAQKLQVY